MQQATWFGQPRGLFILFLTETWERFSFYGMRALLIYYMIKQLDFTQSDASLIYGLYTGIIYLTPLFGGVISDRWLGRRKSVIIGASIMVAGHFMMASEALLFLALATIAIGNGLFLPSLPSQIVDLYDRNDPRRGSAYNVYYAGINLGAFLAPLVCGTLGEVYGWHWGFGAAGIGVSIGLLIYLLGSRYLPADTKRKSEDAIASETIAREDLRSRILIFIGIIAIVVILRGAYEQMGNTVAVWLDAGVDRSVGALQVPRTWFQSINPLLVFALTPLLVMRWTRMARAQREPSPMRKMAAGSVMVALAYFFLSALCIAAAAQGVRPDWPWVLLFFLLITAGELYIYPIGLSLFGRLAPRRYLATSIAAWWIAFFAGNLFAGWLGSFWHRHPPETYFSIVGMVALLAALLFALLDTPVRALEARVQAAGNTMQRAPDAPLTADGDARRVPA